jgi:hypothetical protein
MVTQLSELAVVEDAATDTIPMDPPNGDQSLYNLRGALIRLGVCSGYEKGVMARKGGVLEGVVHAAETQNVSGTLAAEVAELLELRANDTAEAKTLADLLRDTARQLYAAVGAQVA